MRKNAPAPRGNAQNDASEAKIANKIMAQGRIGLTGIGVGANDGGMRGGVVRKKAPAAVASDAKPKQNLGRALNLNYGGSLMNGALVGQSKVTAEMQHAVESVGESGHSLDQYEPLKKLGAGTSGVVHLVKRKTDGSLWVSKEVRLGSKFLNGKGGAPSSERQAMASRAEREAVMHEVKLMSSIQCEHIIEFKAAFADELKVTIIMEYAAGGSVADLVHERRKLNARFDEEDVWRCVVQVASGLQAMHARDIIHRDIKPANVLVSALGAFKIADLGIAVETGSSVQGRLRTGKCGTLICMAPEVCKDKPFDARADIWSLGCLVYEMCWLRPAFPVGSGRIEADLRTVISLQDQARRVEVPACFSGELRDVLASCLQLQQTDRPYARALLQQPFVTAKATELGITIPEGGEKLERRESGGEKRGELGRMPSNVGKEGVISRDRKSVV